MSRVALGLCVRHACTRTDRQHSLCTDVIGESPGPSLADGLHFACPSIAAVHKQCHVLSLLLGIQCTSLHVDYWAMRLYETLYVMQDRIELCGPLFCVAQLEHLHFPTDH